MAIPHPIQCFGIKLVGDNIDVTLTPTDMRSDNQSQSLNYFQLYAVRDRIDSSSMSEEPQLVNPNAPLHELLPTAEDEFAMLSNFGVLIARVLVKHLPFFLKISQTLLFNTSLISTQLRCQQSLRL